MSKGSLVCVGNSLRKSSESIVPICLVQNVANSVHLIDPLTAQLADIPGSHYFRDSFTAICDPKQLVENTVMDIEIIRDRKQFTGQRPISFKHVLADFWVVKSSELGINDSKTHTKAHLGHLLRIGDTVMGYNLRDANVNNDDFDKLKAAQISDVVLVKKHFGEKNSLRRLRKWKLKHLNEQIVTDSDMEG
jgi:nonsense-mediated mRNA decay protein 3